MRKMIVLLGCTALAACSGGQGPTSPGGVAVSGSSSSVNGGSGGGVTAGTGAQDSTVQPGTFLDVSAETTFNAVGSLQSLHKNSTGGVLYEGNASTVNSPSGTITYSPRDAIFSFTFNDTKANISQTYRFQDPAHRTDPNYVVLADVPDLNGFNYLQGIGQAPTDTTTFFYQRPGDATTTYVTLAGYVRDDTTDSANPFYERGAMVFGTPTSFSDVPTGGTGHYTGGLLATMVENPDANANQTYFQWISGTSTIDVDFKHGSVALGLNGTVLPATQDGHAVDPNALTIAQGSTFTANGTATINLTQKGGFTGAFTSAQFQGPNNGAIQTVDFSSISQGSSVAGASSIDGTFYGPKAVNAGGNFRIIGGTPDQRVDILGAFTGAKH
jgi:hypothetical protein